MSQRLLAAILAVLAGLPCAMAAEASRPNIIIILSDDMGFSDLGCYGGEIQTPNVDSLAAGGLRFTQFYNAARCCPARASLLTGLYPHQAGVGHMVDDRGFEGYRGGLEPPLCNHRRGTQARGLRHLRRGQVARHEKHPTGDRGG